MSKKIKLLIIGLVIGFIALVGIGGAATYYFLTNTPKNAYLISEQESAKQLKDYFNERFENEAEFQEKMADESYDSTLKFGAEVPDSLLSMIGVQKSVVDSSNIILNVGHDSKKDNSKLSIKPTIADNEIGNFQWSADKDNQYLETPLFDDIYKVKNDEIKKGVEKASGSSMESVEGQEITNDSLNLNTILSSSQVKQDDIDKITKRYSDLVIDQLEDDNFEKDKEKTKVFGEEEELEKLTMNLNSKDTKKIVIAILEEAKKDKELKELIEKQGNVSNYDSELEDLVKEAKDASASKYPKVKSVIYVDDKKILKRDLTITGEDDLKLNLKGTSKIEDGLQVDYKLTAPGEDGRFTLKGKSSGDDTITDKYNIAFEQDMSSTTELNFENKSKVDGDKRVDQGKFKFNSGSGTPVELDYDHDLTTDVKNNNQKQKLEVSFDNNGEEIKIMMDGKTELKKDVKFDKKDAIDFNSLSDSEIADLNRDIQDKIRELTEDVAKDIQ